MEPDQEANSQEAIDLVARAGRAAVDWPVVLDQEAVDLLAALVEPAPGLAESSVLPKCC